jgi:NAD(P)H-dependent FMN reductase
MAFANTNRLNARYYRCQVVDVSLTFIYLVLPIIKQVMNKNKINILAIPGSLRTTSSSNAILKVVAGMAPENVAFKIYDGLSGLPHFNDSENIPASVESFHRLIREADGILICTPEYAFGVPGSLKNALDWTVGSGDFVNKPVALVTASRVGDKAHASLLQTLTAISADIAEGGTLLISFVRSKLNGKGEVTDMATEMALQEVLNALLTKINVIQS